MRLRGLPWVLCVLSWRVALGWDNGLALTPALGYNTWNDFRCSGISATNVMKVADAMVEKGLARVGYRYLNVDDCWAVGRDPETQELLPDPKAFPRGLGEVADYVHRRGLKFGVYTDRGPLTCAGRPASMGYEQQDAAAFARWGVDYVKEDSCFVPPEDQPLAVKQYAAMRDALNATGRPIYFSLCGWRPWYAPFGASLANSWRMGDDVNTWLDVYRALRMAEPILQFSGPGGWNDLDMLVGSSPAAAINLTAAQSRTQFSLWALLGSPLLLGNSVLNLTAFDLETYTNKEVIALNQDPAGHPPQLLHSTCPPGVPPKEEGAVPPCQQIWGRRLAGGAAGMAMVNFAPQPASITCDRSCLRRLGLDGPVLIRDLWKHQWTGIAGDVSRSVAGAGGSVTLLLRAM